MNRAMNQQDLNSLATEIRQAYAKVNLSVRTALEQAIACGHLLLKAKKQIPHGQFMEFVRTNCGVCQRHANNYLSLARNAKAISKWNWNSNLTITTALLLVAKKSSKATAHALGTVATAAMPPSKQSPQATLGVLANLSGTLALCRKGLADIDWRQEGPDRYLARLDEISAAVASIRSEVARASASRPQASPAFEHEFLVLEDRTERQAV